MYAGENERPVNQINFRNKAQGGLGLINPIVKAKLLLVKNMLKDFINYDTDINDAYVVEGLYGYSELFKDIYLQDMAVRPVKEIYEYLMKEILEKNGSLIPSRNEKKTDNVKWNISWKNLKILSGVNAEEKEFVWKVIQDMVPVGRRIHKKNVERRCLKVLPSGNECQVIPDLRHVFFECESMKDLFYVMRSICEKILESRLENKNLMYLDVNQRKKSKLKIVLWFVVKFLYSAHMKRIFNKRQLLMEILKELEWNIIQMRRIGSLNDMMDLKEKIEKAMWMK